MSSGSKKHFVIETHSPYYLHPADGPGVLITAVIFDGQNFELWERAVLTALRAKNKIPFIDGSLPRPAPKEGEEFSECQAWDMANSTLCSWLLNIIEPKLRTTVAYCDTAKGMWDDLRKRYGTANTLRIHQLKADIANCKQGNLDIGEFYSKLVNLWNELTNLVKIPVCTCKGCSCELSGKIAAMQEQEKVHQFLMGLNDEAFGAVRSQVLASDPLPSLDRIFNITQQEETHRRLMMTRDARRDSAVAFAVKRQPAIMEKAACRICGRFGHEEAVCYEVIGYPSGWEPRGRGGGYRGGRNGRGRGGSRGRGYGRETCYLSSTRHKRGGELCPCLIFADQTNKLILPPDRVADQAI